MMLVGVEEIPLDSVICPAELDPFFDKKPSRLWYLGEPSLLSGKLLGILSARRIDADLASKSSEILQQIASLELTFISGWHSQLEVDALRILLSRSARIISCLSKSLVRFTPSTEIKSLIGQSRILVLTHCSPKAKRISRDASLRRNQLVMGLSKGLLVLSGPEGSVSCSLAQLALNLGRSVFAVQHPMNQDLLASGALPATLENIQVFF